jgi:hypothetical protein
VPTSTDSIRTNSRSALDPERLAATIAKLRDDEEREVLRLLYGERVEAKQA